MVKSKEKCVCCDGRGTILHSDELCEFCNGYGQVVKLVYPGKTSFYNRVEYAKFG